MSSVPEIIIFEQPCNLTTTSDCVSILDVAAQGPQGVQGPQGPPGGVSIGATVTGGTAGRVLYEGTGHVLADNANLTYDGSTLTVRANAGQSAPILACYQSGGFLTPTINADGGISIATGGNALLVSGGTATFTSVIVNFNYLQVYGGTADLNSTSGYPLRLYSSSGTTVARTAMAIGTTGEIPATHVPLTIQGVASQSADLQQWQDSSGNILSKIDHSGNLSGPTIGYADGNNYLRGSTLTAQIIASGTNAPYPVLVVAGAASQTGNLTEWKDSSGNVLASMGYNGNLITVGALTAGYFGSSNGTVIINGTGSVLYFYGVGSSTNISWNSGLSLNGDASNPVQVRAPLQVYSPAASSVANTIQLAASQTADAVQVKNSSGTVLAKIDSAGNVAAGNVAAGNVVGSTFSTGTALGDKFSLYDGGSSNWYGIGIDPGAIYFKLGAGKYFTFGVGGGFACGAASIGGLVAAGAISLGSGSGSRIKLYDTNGPNDAGLGINMGQAGNAMGFYIANADNFTIERAAVNESYPFPSGILTAVTVSGSTGNMGIGTILPAGKLHVQTTAAVPCGILQLAASQSADALQVRDSSGNVLASISANGTISSPQGTQSEHFGAASTAASIFSTAIGYGASAGNSGNNNATAVGHLASALEQGTAIGKSATSTGSISTAIGYSSLANNFFSTAIGAGAQATASAGLAIGCTSLAGGPDSSFCLGYGATSNYVGAMALGRDSVTTQANQAVLGANAGSSYAINCLTIPGMAPLAPSGVPNNSLFLDSSNSNKLSWKDSSGTTSPLI